MVSVSILTQLFQSVILSMSAMDLDLIDPEVEAHMELEEVFGDNEAFFQFI